MVPTRGMGIVQGQHSDNQAGRSSNPDFLHFLLRDKLPPAVVELRDRGVGITTYLENGGKLEVAQHVAAQ
jgi:hypothetical protein